MSIEVKHGSVNQRMNNIVRPQQPWDTSRGAVVNMRNAKADCCLLRSGSPGINRNCKPQLRG